MQLKTVLSYVHILYICKYMYIVIETELFVWESVTFLNVHINSVLSSVFSMYNTSSSCT